VTPKFQVSSQPSPAYPFEHIIFIKPNDTCNGYDGLLWIKTNNQDFNFSNRPIAIFHGNLRPDWDIFSCTALGTLADIFSLFTSISFMLR